MTIVDKRVIITDEASQYCGEHGVITTERRPGHWIVKLDSDGMISEVNGMQFCFEVRQTETAWMIEDRLSERPAWWTGKTAEFSSDPNTAIHFCTRADAEAVAKHIPGSVATEHIWPAA